MGQEPNEQIFHQKAKLKISKNSEKSVGLWYTSDIYIYLGSQRQNMGQKPNKKNLIIFLSEKKSCSLNPVPPSHTLACHEFNMQYNCLEATRGGRWHNWGEWLFFRGNILNDNVLQRIRNSGHIWLCTILFRKGNFKYQNLYFRWSLPSESWILRIQWDALKKPFYSPCWWCCWFDFPMKRRPESDFRETSVVGASVSEWADWWDGCGREGNPQRSPPPPHSHITLYF